MLENQASSWSTATYVIQEVQSYTSSRTVKGGAAWRQRRGAPGRQRPVGFDLLVISRLPRSLLQVIQKRWHR